MAARGPLVYRQSGWTRATHLVWAVSLFFLLLSGLQIFNAFPKLIFGQEAGFDYDNAFLEIGAQVVGEERQGYLDLWAPGSTPPAGWACRTTRCRRFLRR